MAAIERFISTGFEYIGKTPVSKIFANSTPYSSNLSRYGNDLYSAPNIIISGHAIAKNTPTRSSSFDNRTIELSFTLLSEGGFLSFRMAFLVSMGIVMLERVIETG